MSEPDWKQALRDSVNYWVSGDAERKAKAFDALLSYVDDAYHRGLAANRSRAGYRTTRKKKEEPWSTDVPSVGSPSLASTTDPPEGAAP